ncbi:hypothetical protein [Deinococcus sonorensis]|uniref:Uncharacterized protein n=2 Tax=Deinococcus sonorensis TaxID=309891 RepID=A0AAU7UF45_9DEIO
MATRLVASGVRNSAEYVLTHVMVEEKSMSGGLFFPPSGDEGSFYLDIFGISHIREAFEEQHPIKRRWTERL